MRAVAPSGVDAVFDHLGGDSLRTSWDLLAPGGTLVSYALAAHLDDPGEPSLLRMFLAHSARLAAWDLMPNGRSASFYNIWSGRTLRRAGSGPGCAPT